MLPDLLRFTAADIAELMSRWDGDGVDAGLDAAIEAALLESLDGAHIGIPYTFREQYAGRLVHDIWPAPGHESEISSRGRVPLRLHTDDAFLDATARPDRLALVGLCDPSAVPTTIVAVDDLLDQLGDETVAALCQPYFLFRRPASFAVGRGEVFTCWPRPVLHPSAGGPVLAALATGTRVAPEADPDAHHHLGRFEEAVMRAPRTELLLTPGEILVISNSRCLHGRGAIRGARWLKRVYLRNELTLLDQVASTGEAGVYAATAAFQHAERSQPAW